jgi:indolepyruvate ferredoxin oxidoreductase
MTGMSQKNGAVTSHVRIARQPEDIQAQRIATGEADLILGCDMLTAGAHDAISKTRPGRTVAVINTHEQPPGPFTRNPDWQFPAEQIRALIDESVGGRSHFLNGTRLATALMGDSIATNLFMLGYAFQKGLVPLLESSILQAIELNGVAIEGNKQAFGWGRRAALDLNQVEKLASPAQPVVVHLPQSLDVLIARRIAVLTEYQNAAYARRYRESVEEVRRAEAKLGAGDALTRAVAKSLFKLMAYKDEYEVARLYTNGDFEKRLNQAFEGDFTLKFNLAPPVWAKRDAQGRLIKAQYGSWMWYAFKLLARIKFLRGTALDLFGKTEERRLERQLIEDYCASMSAAANKLSADNLALVSELASLPEQIRGFGHVKLASVEKARARWRVIEQALNGPAPGAAEQKKAA